jgi:hypothetical protein
MRNVLMENEARVEELFVGTQITIAGAVWLLIPSLRRELKASV